MVLEINLPETAKALSKPLTKLIEVIAAGCGRVYEPTGVRRKARADGEAMVVMELAREQATEIAMRAAQRLIDTEERRQGNIDRITAGAATIIPEEVAEDPVDPDWSARFFADCQDVSNEQMQSIWAKLLAGEVARPGSFSQRTLSVVKNLQTTEAQHFNVLVKNSLIVQESAYVPFVGIGSRDGHFWEGHGLNLTAFNRLSEAGLVTYQPLGFSLQTNLAMLMGPKRYYFADSPQTSDFALGNVEFTAVGAELAQICEWNIDERRETDILQGIRAPFVVKDTTEGFGPMMPPNYARDIRMATWLNGDFNGGTGETRVFAGRLRVHRG